MIVVNIFADNAQKGTEVILHQFPRHCSAATCDGGEEDADEDGPGGVDVHNHHVPHRLPPKVPLGLILTVGNGVALRHLL